MKVKPQMLTIDIGQKENQTAWVILGELGIRDLDIRVVQNGRPFDLSKINMSLYAKTIKGDTIFNTINVVDPKKGKGFVTVPDQISSQIGKHKCCITFIAEGKLMLSFDFFIKVDDSVFNDRAIVSSNEFSTLVDALSGVADLENNYVPRLTQLENGKTDKTTTAALSNRVDGAYSQLAEITMQSYKTDITTDVEGLGINENIPVDYLQTLQIKNISQFYKKNRNGVTTTFCLQGDSTFYGHDTTSSDKRPPLAPNVQTRASVTPSEALQEYCNEVFGIDKINVINRGFSGDGTRDGYNRYTKKSGADLTIMNYGINDATASWIDYNGDITTFINWYEKLISREILRGSAIVLLTPLKQRVANNIKIDIFSSAIKELGKKYNIPVILGDEILANMSYDIYSDDVHLNGKGYRKLGAKLFPILLGEGLLNIKNVASGTKLLTRGTIDSVYHKNSTFSNSNGADTPNEISLNNGICLNIGSGSVVYYGFYATDDDLIVIPNIYLDNADAEISLDFKTENPCFSCSSLVGFGNTFENVKPRESSILSTNNKTTFSRNMQNISDKYIHIANKGWHTLKIEVKRNVNNGALRGVEFINYDIYKLYENSINKVSSNYYHLKTHNSYTDTTDVIKTDINLIELSKQLLLPQIYDEYWKGYALTVKVNNFDQSILEYTIFIGNLSDGGSFKLCKDTIRHNIATTPTIERLLSSISYNPTGKILSLNWSGATTRPTSVTITI